MNLSIFLASFWADFWPNMCATTIGAIIGIPIAFWINRVVASANDKRYSDNQSLELVAALSMIRDAARRNREIIEQYREIFQTGNAIMATTIDVSVWRATQDTIVKLLNDIILKGEIARHFYTLEKFIRSSDNYFQLAASQRGISQEIKDNIEGNLVQSCDVFIKYIPWLIEKIDESLESTVLTVNDKRRFSRIINKLNATLRKYGAQKSE